MTFDARAQNPDGSTGVFVQHAIPEEFLERLRYGHVDTTRFEALPNDTPPDSGVST